jgi:hypothetical protein
MFGAIVLNKHSGLGAVPAQAVAKVLVTLGVMSNEDFLNKTATTLYGAILVPFVPGTIHAYFNLVSQLTTLAHELEHVVQFREHPLGFPFEYLVDSRQRAIAEVDAMKPALLLRHQIEPLKGSPAEVAARYAAKLSTYRCDEDDIETAKSLLTPFVTSVLAGAETSRRYPQVAAILDAMGAA